MTNRLVLVCGLPSSGNRFLVASIKAAWTAAHERDPSVTRSVGVWHGEVPTHPGLAGFEGVDVVIPVRNPRCRRLSMLRTDKDPDRFPEVELRRNVAALCAKRQVRTHIVSYEAMVADPEGVAAELFEFLGLPPIELEVEDGNAKYDQESRP